MTFYILVKLEPNRNETDGDTSVGKSPKCQVRDVIASEPEVGSTSGFGFPVGEDLNRFGYSGDFWGTAYFRSGELSKTVFSRSTPPLEPPIFKFGYSDRVLVLGEGSRVVSGRPPQNRHLDLNGVGVKPPSEKVRFFSATFFARLSTSPNL